MPRRIALSAILILVGLCGLFDQMKINGGDDTSVYYQIAGKCLGRPSWYLLEFQDPEDVLSPIAYAHGGKLLLHYSRMMPYRDFVCEYPPAALMTFILPRLLTDNVPRFYYLFAGEMALAVMGTGWVAYRLARIIQPGRSVLTMVSASWMLWIWASGRTLTHRFDVMVVLFTALGTLYVLQRRWEWAGLWLGFGAAMKIYPVFILIPATILALGDRRWQSVLRLLGSAALVPLISHLVLMPWTGMSVFNYLSYHSQRGVEAESIWAQLILFFDNSADQAVHSVRLFGSDQLESTHDLHPWITASYISMLATNALCIAIAFFKIRPLPREATNWQVRVIALFVAAIVFTVVTAKVISIQYIYWLFPFAMLLPSRMGKAISVFYVIALALGHFWYPDYWVAVGGLTTPAMIMVFSRNLLLIAVGVMAAVTAATYNAEHADLKMNEVLNLDEVAALGS